MKLRELVIQQAARGGHPQWFFHRIAPRLFGFDPDKLSYSEAAIASRHLLPFVLCCCAASCLVLESVSSGDISPDNIGHQLLRALPISLLALLLIGEIVHKLVSANIYERCPEFDEDVENYIYKHKIGTDVLQNWMFNDDKHGYDPGTLKKFIDNKYECNRYNDTPSPHEVLHLLRVNYVRHLDNYPGSQSVNTFLFTVGSSSIILTIILMAADNELGLHRMHGFIPGNNLLNSLVIVALASTILIASTISIVVRNKTSKHYSSNYKLIELAKAVEGNAEYSGWFLNDRVEAVPHNACQIQDHTVFLDDTDNAEFPGTYIKLAKTIEGVFYHDNTISQYEHNSPRLGSTGLNARDIHVKHGHISSAVPIAIQSCVIIIFMTCTNAIMSDSASRIALSTVFLVISTASLIFTFHRFFERRKLNVDRTDPSTVDYDDNQKATRLRDSKFLYNAETFAMGFSGVALFSVAMSSILSPAIIEKFMHMDLPNASIGGAQLTAGHVTLILVLAVVLITVTAPLIIHACKKAKDAISNDRADINIPENQPSGMIIDPLEEQINLDKDPKSLSC